MSIDISTQEPTKPRREDRAHRPSPGRPVPVSTYRLQIRAEQGFDDAAALVDYLADLGVSHVYLSPVLAATPGSAHGYDVLDHSRLSQDAGGRAAFDRLAAAAHERGLGLVVDVVPNHMTVPSPVRLNKPLWSVLREGPSSPFASWFDIAWRPFRGGTTAEAGGANAVLMPVLGDRIGAVLARGEVTLDTSGDEPVLRYFDHEFPVRAGTEQLPLAELVDRQWYRLAYWKVADDELNYRRFFDVDTLVAVRVEDPEVFLATHALLLELQAAGQVDGFRIDHPDGLADPRGYLRRLAEATGGAWVVVEKILEGEETLPDDWPCAGTTGYDALREIGGLFVDPSGGAPLLHAWHDLSTRGATPQVRGDMASVSELAKREVISQSLFTEVARLVELLRQICRTDVRLRDHTRRSLTRAVTEILVAFERYRAYVVPGEPAPGDQAALVEHAADEARRILPDDLADTVDLVRDLLLGREAGSAGRMDEKLRAELMVRFQQTCGPVMAKGIEDTAFYRSFLLSSLNEVGGDPDRFASSREHFHAFAAHLVTNWPTAMTTLSTHDTKRSEDARARLHVLSERPISWHRLVLDLTELVDTSDVDGATEYLLWQTLVATWDTATGQPIPAERLHGYLLKAVREAKIRTTWTEQDEDYEQAVLDLADEACAHPQVLELINAFLARTAPLVRTVVLGQKLLQLTMPGVPDVYQGTEIVDLSLVDPDNRRPVDFTRRRELLARLDSGAKPSGLDEEKLLVTSRALRLRRDLPEVFVGTDCTYAPLPTTTELLVAFERGTTDDGARVVVLATRMQRTLDDLGGWGDHRVGLPPGEWQDVLTGRTVTGGDLVPVAGLLSGLPVALLTRIRD